jgi:Arc/MetJ-type ribon-helix-helix transcriptional regulator
MANISVSLPDELLLYIDRKIENHNSLIQSLLQHWRQQQEEDALATACALVDELDLGWDSGWQTAAITDLEASGL